MARPNIIFSLFFDAVNHLFVGCAGVFTKIIVCCTLKTSDVLLKKISSDWLTKMMSCFIFGTRGSMKADFY